MIRWCGLLFLVLVGLVLSYCHPALAQRVCGLRADILDTIRESHNEIVVAGGISEGGMLMEVLASESGTWTIISTTPQRVTCVLSSGYGWQHPIDIRSPFRNP